MLELKTDNTTRGRFLFFFLLFTILTQGLQPLYATSMRTHAPGKAKYHRYVDLSPAHHFNFPESFLEDEPDLIGLSFHSQETKPKRRIYLTTAFQQYTFTTRLQQLSLNLSQYVPEDESKTGIYQWHDAFLPAYYTFLFMYTLF